MPSSKNTPTKAGKTGHARHMSTNRLEGLTISPSKKMPLGTPGSRRSGRMPNSGWSSRLPTEGDRKKNGRVSGRSLICWNRPRMAEKLLLHLQYECSIAGINLPWDRVAHRFHPGSSGQAVVQHLNRLRPVVMGEGHLVPPAPSRPGAVSNDQRELRGFMRDDEHGEHEDVNGTRYRSVQFAEPIEDRKFNLPTNACFSAPGQPKNPTAYAEEDTEDESQEAEYGSVLGAENESPTVGHGRRAHHAMPESTMGAMENVAYYDGNSFGHSPGMGHMARGSSGSHTFMPTSFPAGNNMSQGFMYQPQQYIPAHNGFLQGANIMQQTLATASGNAMPTNMAFDMGAANTIDPALLDLDTSFMDDFVNWDDANQTNAGGNYADTNPGN